MDSSPPEATPPVPDRAPVRTTDAAPGPLYFFLHLQKTGGTSLFIRLRNHFGERAVYPMPEYERSFETSFGIEPLIERFARHRHEIRVVSGHLPYCVPELLGEPFTTFTVLREPVARSLSFLRQQRVQVPQFRDLTLTEIYADPMRREWLMTNHMVRMLSLTAEQMRAGPDMVPVPDEERLGQACTNLAEMDAVGVQEHFDEFCDELTFRYGWDLGERVTANRSTHHDTDPGLIERIEADNQADIELYRFALDLRQRRAAVAQIES